ncbi:MAG: VIT1/CCC1 transporter family protein [Promethearchaeia archaeon]
MLTSLGILLGFFVVILKNPEVDTVESIYVIFTGFGTAISMLISGLSGSYLSERAEMRKEQIELEKAMALYGNIKMDERSNREEIKKAMLLSEEKEDQIKKWSEKLKQWRKEEISEKKEQETLHEKAEKFTSIIVSSVNGLSPFLGGIIPIIPFFIKPFAGFPVFIGAFTIILAFIVLLGVFLGKVSKESIIKNIFQMMGFFFLTVLLTVLFLGM